MMETDLQSEVERLREEVESYRQRELADLRAALSAAREEADHFRREAQRNADIGRQVAAGYQQQLTEMRTKLEAYQELQNGRSTIARGRVVA